MNNYESFCKLTRCYHVKRFNFMGYDCYSIIKVFGERLHSKEENVKNEQSNINSDMESNFEQMFMTHPRLYVSKTHWLYCALDTGLS